MARPAAMALLDGPRTVEPPCVDRSAGRSVMILMRGLPSCGKSTTARRLVENGGVVLEFDEYFYLHVGSNPKRYDWDSHLLPAARRHFYGRIKDAVDAQTSRIVIDNDNTLHRSTAAYVSYADAQGYVVEFREPDSPWWRAIRELLDDKERHAADLRRWASKLALMSRATHRVPFDTFQRRIAQWQSDLTVADIVGAIGSGSSRRMAGGSIDRRPGSSLEFAGREAAHSMIGS